MSSEDEYVDEDEEQEGESSSGGGCGGDTSDAISEDTFIASDDDESCGNNGSDAYEPNESSEEDRKIISQRRTRSATRTCSAKTNEKMSRVIQKERMTEKEALGGLVQEVDKEYLYDSPSPSEGKDTKDRPIARPRKQKRRRTTINSEDEEESSNLTDEEEDSGELQNGFYPFMGKRKPNTPRKRKTKANAKRVRRNLAIELEEEGSDSNGEDDNVVLVGKGNVLPTRSQEKYSHHSPTKLKGVMCPSTKDELTKIDLPKGKPHVCCVSPDGRQRHCYTLDTLYRVAISKHHAGALQLLQPPDFVYPMEDDLIDQIASRFGRSALNIGQSGVYKEMQLRDESGDESEGESEDESEDDCEHFKRYLMGSSDLYCCPLCYSEAYRRQGNLAGGLVEDDDSEEEDGNNEKPDEDPFLFEDDPMTILSNIGLSTASTFCFRLLKSVQNHVRFVHGVDPSEMKGNGLFQRFQIRAGDGLLQHWPRIRRLKNMWEYWASEGASTLNKNRDTYKQLSRLIDKGLLKGEQSGTFGSSFSCSFPNRAKNVWVKLSEPFLKSLYEDVSEMIDDESVDEGIKPRPVLQEEQDSDPEESMVKHLREKREERGKDDSSNIEAENSSVSDRDVDNSSNEAEDSSASDSSRSVSEDQSSSGEEDGCSKVEESEEEETKDFWMEAKMIRPTAARMRERNGSQDSEDDSLFNDSGKIVEPVRSNIVSPQKRIIDSDDED